MAKNEKRVRRVIRKIEKSDGFNDFVKFFHNIDAAILTFFKFVALIFGFAFSRKKNENSENERKYHQSKSDAFRPELNLICSPLFATVCEDYPFACIRR